MIRHNLLLSSRSGKTLRMVERAIDASKEAQGTLILLYKGQDFVSIKKLFQSKAEGFVDGYDLIEVWGDQWRIRLKNLK